MKPATQAVRDILQKNTDVRAVPRLLAEWDHNRYSKIADIIAVPGNPVDNIDWNGTYDLEAVTLPNRPKTGIAKGRLNESIKLATGYRDKPTDARYYAASDTDIYKYWASYTRTKLAPVATNDYEFAAPIVITMTYEAPVVSNKIVVGFDVSFAKPKSYDIEIRRNGTWTKISQSYTVPNDGVVSLWRKSDGSGTWDDVPVYDSATTLDGVRLTVRSMMEPYSHLDLIQMGARLENDLSEFVIDYSRNFSLSSRSFIAPLGESSSNEGTLNLTNYDLRFNNDNEDSVYYGLIDKKVKFTMDLAIDARPTGSQNEYIREFTMYADNWGGQDQDSVTIDLKDSSIFLQEVDLPKIFWENLTIGAIVWEIMDTVGLTNYKYSRDVLDTGQLMPYFWSREGTAWEVISDLAEGTQTAVYFDEYDILQIKTRKALFGGSNTTVNWNLDAVQNAQKLPDIISVSGDDSLVVNDVTINWKPAEFSDFNNGLPKMETVWEPEGDNLVLRSSALTKDLLIASPTMWIKQSEAVYWPYESLVNIRGEIIRYKGKEYQWRKPGGGTALEWVYSQEDVEKVKEKSNPLESWANTFTGQLKIDKRAIGGSVATNHYIRPMNYSAKRTTWTNNGFTPINLNSQGGMYYNDGVMTLSPPFSANAMDYFYVQHESTISGHPNATYGMRFRFPTQNLLHTGAACAGIWIDGDWGDTGYVIEFRPTPQVEAENRFFAHEVTMNIMPANAPAVPWAGFGVDVKGFKLQIIPGEWYDVDVVHNVDSNLNVNLRLFVNGVVAGVWYIPANRRFPSNGKNGLFVRGNCKADFEYFYGMNHNGDPRFGTPGTYIAEPDQSSYLDLVTGSFTSGFIEREFSYGQYWSTNRGPAREGGYTFQAKNTYMSYFFDEFGPTVHEIREFNIAFDDSDGPVGHSYLYLSNNSQVVCTDYNADAFGAKFTLANSSRRDAIVKGEDKITAGEDNPIDQKVFIYGRVLYQEEENELVKKDDFSIRRKGPVTLTFDNRFIQTKEAADDLGQWVVDLWGLGADELTVEIFGNPLIQVGDLVTINHPVKGMSPTTHQYYVVETKGEFNEGYTSRLICRRARL